VWWLSSGTARVIACSATKTDRVRESVLEWFRFTGGFVLHGCLARSQHNVSSQLGSAESYHGGDGVSGGPPMLARQPCWLEGPWARIRPVRAVSVFVMVHCRRVPLCDM
jgi:hypothetical protein